MPCATDIRYQIAIDGKIDEGVTADLSEIEVTEAVRGETTFRIRFAIDICGPDIQLLSDERLLPGKDRELAVLVNVDGDTSCLVNGIITDRKADLKEGGPGSSLEIAGKDRRVLMGRNADEKPANRGTVGLIVIPILARYHFIPDVEQGDTTLYSDFTNSLNQVHSDLELVTKLAADHGYEFWIDYEVAAGFGPVVKIVEKAHFKTSPPRGVGPTLSRFTLAALEKDPVLKMNTGDGQSTLLAFSSERASETPNQSGNVSRVDIDSASLERTSVDGPTLNPLGDKPPAPTNKRQIISAGNAQEARRRQEAALNDAAWTIKANAETTVHAFGKLLRPHNIVKVEGTGKIDDGDYFVWSVTHHIDPADHKMRCELRRNAIGGV